VKKRRRLIAPVVALFATHLRSHCPDKEIASLPDRRSDCDTPSQVPSGLLGRINQRSCPSESSDLSLREERALEFNRIRKSSEINLHFQSAAISFLYSFYLLSVAHSSPRSAHAPECHSLQRATSSVNPYVHCPRICVWPRASNSRLLLFCFISFMISASSHATSCLVG